MLDQLGRVPSHDPKLGISPEELAATIIKTLKLKEIVEIRTRLVPTILGHQGDGSLDRSGRIEIVVDWKSDVTMSQNKLAAYRAQLADYRKETGAEHALLVLMTQGIILTV